MTKSKVTGEDLIFLIEAVFAVSTGIGTDETRKAFLSNESKVKRLVELQDTYGVDTIRQSLEQLQKNVFEQWGKP